MARKGLVLAAALVLSIAAIAATDSRAAVSPPPPAGVEADAWQYISDSVGLAIRYETGRKGERELFGTVMVREGGRWQAVRFGSGPVGMVPAR